MISKTLFLPAICFAVAILAGSSYSTDYYVSPAGNDNNAGTGSSSSQAWASISKVNNVTFSAGDKVLFEGGKTFTGTVTFNSSDKGSSSARLIIGSYGTGRATINANGQNGITINGSSYVTVRNINVKGLGIYGGQASGTIGLSLVGTSFAMVDSVEAGGFRWAGVGIDNCSDVRITNVFAYDNGYAGIVGRNNVTRFYIGYCRASKNPGDSLYTSDISGSGIEIKRGSYGMIEYCRADSNGGKQNRAKGNGPVGIWLAYGAYDTIQYCIANNNTNNTGDGGGFDFDAQTHHCILQYCCAYFNKSYGIQFWQASGSQWVENNVVRYNIFDHNAGPEIWLGGWDPNTGVRNNLFHNNLVYTNFQAFGTAGSTVTTNKFFNNIFWVRTGSRFLDTGVTQAGNNTFQGNCYWSNDGKFSVWGYSSLADWANGTGQEKVQGNIVGIFADPQITYFSGTTDPRPTDPRALTALTSYLLKDSSPCIDAGINLQTVAGVNPGTKDLWGTAIPFNNAFDIGPNEHHTSVAVRQDFKHALASRSLPTSAFYDLLGRQLSQHNWDNKLANMVSNSGIVNSRFDNGLISWSFPSQQ